MTHFAMRCPTFKEYDPVIAKSHPDVPQPRCLQCTPPDAHHHASSARAGVEGLRSCGDGARRAGPIGGSSQNWRSELAHHISQKLPELQQGACPAVPGGLMAKGAGTPQALRSHSPATRTPVGMQPQ